MTRLSPLPAVLFALGLGTVIATTTQCKEAPRDAGPVTNGSRAPRNDAPQDPQGGAAPLPAGDRVKILVSGSMQGRLEPCGCASGQLGGLPRRMQHIGEQRDYDLLLEGGNIVQGATELDMLKGFTALQVLMMPPGYDALGVGPNDLLLELDEWAAYLTMVPTVTSDLVSTMTEWPGLPFLEKTVREHTVRVASFTGALPERGADAAKLPFALVPPVEAWQGAMAGAADSTLRILMHHGTDAAARELIPQLAPAPDLVVSFDQTHSEPAAQPETVAGVPLVFAGIRGRVLLELTLARTADGPSIGYTPVPLPASKTVAGGGGDPDVKTMLLQHREQVAADDILQKLAERRPTKSGNRYMGSQTCANCHPTAYAAWQKTKHAHAWQTLVDAEQDPKRYGWPVTEYPDCVSCHVVGYGEESGFIDAVKTPQLLDVGCERCHGPGSAHVMLGPEKNPLGIIGGALPSEMCAECHDFEQSPDFLYGDRWKLIEHGREPHMPPKKK